MLGRVMTTILLALICIGGSTSREFDPASPLWQAAQQCERIGNWELAADYYRQLETDSGRSPSLRIALARTIRRADQARRLLDPNYRQFAANLSLSQALDLYAESLARIEQLYVDQVSMAQLYQSGIDELVAASTELQEFAHTPTEMWLPLVAPPISLASARDAAKHLALTTTRLTGVPHGLVILELAAGACVGLDEHSQFFAPGRDDELAELGLSLVFRDNKLIVQSVKADSWAEHARIARGSAVRRAGARLQVQFAAEPMRTIVLPIDPASIRESIVVSGRSVGVIHLDRIGAQLVEELDDALARFAMNDVKSLVLDLRQVPGGSLTAAIQTARMFLNSGVIVSSAGQNSAANRTFHATSAARCQWPIVVLVDSQTASAAEVLAAALKENNRALVVGQSTYGKATVQQLFPLESGCAIRLTFARLFGPHGRSHHDVGVSPHVFEPDPKRQLAAAIEQAETLIER